MNVLLFESLYAGSMLTIICASTPCKLAQSIIRVVGLSSPEVWNYFQLYLYYWFTDISDNDLALWHREIMISYYLLYNQLGFRV